MKFQIIFYCLVKNAFFTKKNRKIVFQLKMFSFILKLYSENRFKIRAVVNEIHAFKIVLYGVCMGVILSKL